AGLQKEEIIGEKSSKILEQIGKPDSDLIEICKKVGTKGGYEELALHSGSQKKYYKIEIKSSEKYYFITFIKNMVDDLKNELATSDFSEQKIKEKKAKHPNQSENKTYAEVRKSLTERIEAGMRAGNLAWWEMQLPSGKVIFDDKKAEMLGYNPDHFNTYEDFTDLVHPEDHKQVMQAMRQHLNGQAERYEVEYRIKTQAGDYKYFRDVGKITEQAESSEYMRIIGIVIDITQQKKTELELEKKTKTLEGMLNGINNVVGFQKPDHTILRYNEAGYEMLGKSAQEVIGKKCYELLGREKECDICPTRKTLETKESESVEKFIPELKEYVKATANPILNEDQKISFIIEQLQNITERKTAENKRNEFEGILRSTLNAIDSLLVVVDKDYHIVLSNWTDHEWVPREKRKDQPLCYKVLKDLDSPCEYCPPAKTFQDGKERWYEDVNPIDGSSKEISVIPIFNDEQEVEYVLENVRDVTEIRKAKDELQLKEKKYRAIFDNANDAIFMHGITKDQKPGKFVEVNDLACETLGYTKEEFLNMTPSNIDAAVKSEKRDRIFKEILQEGKSTFEMSHTTKNGATIPMEISSHLFTINDEDYVLSIARNISERKLAEKKMKDSKNRLEQFFKINLDLLCIANTDGYFVKVNKTWERVLGYNKNELEGSKFLNFVHPNDLEATVDAIARLESQKEVINFVNRYECKDGSYRYLEWRSAPSGDLIYAAARDITENMEAARKLKETKEQLELAVEGGNLGTWDWNIKTGEVKFNRNWATMLGYSLDEIEPHISTWEKLVHPEDLPIAKDELKAHLKGETNFYKAEFRMQHKSGNWVWIMDSGRVTERNNKGKALRACGIHISINKLKKTQKKLQESKDRYQKLSNLSFEGILIHNDGKLIDGNKSLSKMIGYEHGELFGQNIIKKCVPVQYHAKIRKNINKNSTKAYEIEAQRKDGTTFPAKIQSRNFRDGDKKLRVTAVRDITEQKKAEQALRESEEKFRSFVENANDIIFSTSLEGDFTYISPNWKEILGHESEKVLGKNFKDFVYSEDIPQVQEFFEKVITTGEKRKGVEYRVKHQDGRYRWHTSTGSPMKDDQGHIVAFLGIARDITERKKIINALEESEERFRTIFNHSPQPMTLTETHTGMLLEVNDIFCEKIEGNKEDIIGKSTTDLNLYTNRERKKFLKSLHDKGAVEGLEIKLTTLNGSKLITKMYSRFVDVNREEYILTIFHDITKQKEAERNLKKLNKKLKVQSVEAQKLAAQAQAANVAKSEFLANMSHEIRTPLNSVIGFTELVLDTELNNTQRDYLKNVNISAQSLMALINDILDFSKIEAGRLELDRTETDLINLLEKTADIIKMKAHNKGLELLINIDPDIPSIVFIDPVRLRQVLVNLLNNAIKFTKRGEIELKAKLIKQEENKARITFTVRDTGIGIKKDQKEKIFNSFTQADGSTSRKYGGTGLGLTISKHLVEKMDGELKVESEYGKGSAFSFSLEVEIVEKQQSRQENIKINKSLVIDDNENNRTILENMLSNWNIKSLLASNGKKGIEKYKKFYKKIDLVIIDYHMPDMNGLQTAREITEIQGEKPTILLYSSAEKNITYADLDEFGIDISLEKPVKQKKLRSTIQYFTNSSSAQTKETTGDQEDHIIYEKFKLLIAEDNEMNMMLSKNIISEFFPNAEIIEADNGKQAINKYRKQHPDLILMDIQMPIMDGLNATQIIRKEDDNIPIVALTAGVLKEEKAACIEAGMNTFLGKPIDKDNLIEIIAGNLDLEFEQQSKSDFSEISGLAKRTEFFDYKKVKQEYGEEVTQQLINKTINILPDYHYKLLQAYEKENFKSLKRIAHTIKGMAMNIYAQKLRETAKSIEQTLNQKDKSLLEKDIHEFSEVYKQTLESVRIKQKNNPAGKEQ
ncbi:MAG: PAS domain S-box protein, partial [Candidatus Marinimicrobia bacterium]|nr:PAS domain S-box protein [Candidatus Neomarinimicrobiota bacterium]